MAVTFSIVSSAGTFSAGPAYDPNYPIFERDFDYVRLNDQAPAYRKVKIKLNGFFEGDSSVDIITAYNNLRDILAGGNVLLTIKTGSIQVVPDSQPVYVESYAEPEDWKEYDGSYSVSLYYFATATPNTEITASYVTSAGTYNFSPTPSWGRNIKPSRPDNRTSPAGEVIGSIASVSLSGFLIASSHAALVTLVNSLQSAFNRNGTLNYGGFSHSVRVLGSVDIPLIYPERVAPYNISLEYDIGEIVDFSAKRTYSRIHHNPIIRPKPLCDQIIVKLMGTSGQEIAYDMKVKAEDINTARTLLAVEAANFVVPGGVELPGGKEVHDEDNNEITVSFVKFYNPPVLANLAGTF